eukprot:EG_transcript_17523
MPAYNQVPQKADSEGFLKKLVSKCKGKKSHKDPAIQQPPQAQASSQHTPTAGSAPQQQPQVQRPPPQPQPASPQRPEQPLQPVQVTPPEEQAPPPSNEFQYPRCRLEGEFPKFHSPLREPTDSPQREWEHRHAPSSRQEEAGSSRGRHRTPRGRDYGEGSLEERYRRFLHRTGRVDDYNHLEGAYPDYTDDDYYDYESHDRRRTSQYNGYSDMEYCGLPQPPRPPPKFSMSDMSEREPPTGPYVPSEYAPSYRPQMDPQMDTGYVQDRGMFQAPGYPAQAEMNYLAAHTDYTYIVPLPPGVYPNIGMPNTQQPAFWTAPPEVMQQYSAPALQPTANTKVTEWASDTSFNLPYNST